MENKKEQIDNFLQLLRNQSINDENIEDKEVGTFLKHFAVMCKKCGSGDVFVSWEKGVDYGAYTGYSEGQKLFKCNSCGNAYSFWS